MYKSFTLCAAFAATTAYAKVVELTSEMEKAIDEFYTKPFTVVSFFNSSESSKRVDGLLDGAKAIIDEGIAAGDISERDIAWIRVDIEKSPELAFSRNV